MLNYFPVFKPSSAFRHAIFLFWDFSLSPCSFPSILPITHFSGPTSPNTTSLPPPSVAGRGLPYPFPHEGTSLLTHLSSHLDATALVLIVLISSAVSPPPSFHAGGCSCALFTMNSAWRIPRLNKDWLDEWICVSITHFRLQATALPQT